MGGTAKNICTSPLKMIYIKNKKNKNHEKIIKSNYKIFLIAEVRVFNASLVFSNKDQLM